MTLALKRIWSRLMPATKYDLKQLEYKLMATLKDLDDEISNDLAAAATAITSALTTLESQIAAGTDTQPQIDHIKAIASALKTAADGATPTVTVPPAPPAA